MTAIGLAIGTNHRAIRELSELLGDFVNDPKAFMYFIFLDCSIHQCLTIEQLDFQS
jgi:hypothetical protein